MTRVELHPILCDILNCPIVGQKCRAYFQPGPNVKMNYPAIVYDYNDIPARHADNKVYHLERVFSLTIIDKDPESDILEKIVHLPKTNFNRSFKSDNLNHWVVTIY